MLVPASSMAQTGTHLFVSTLLYGAKHAARVAAHATISTAELIADTTLPVAAWLISTVLINTVSYAGSGLYSGVGYLFGWNQQSAQNTPQQDPNNTSTAAATGPKPGSAADID